MDTYHNPVRCVANSGKLVEPSHHNGFGELSSRTITIDSRDRDRGTVASPKFINANSFMMRLPIRMKLVHSIELLEAIIPIPVAAGTERYVVLSLADPRGGGPKQTFEVLQAAQPDDPTAPFNPVTEHSFTTIPLIDEYTDSAPSATAHWRKGEDRAVKFFFPQRASMDTIFITLNLRGNGTVPIPYPLADEPPAVATDEDNNIYLKFDFVTQN